MQQKLSQSSIKLLKQKLPFFYKIYLDNYPTISELLLIKKDLKNMSNIKRVETFSSDHSKIYSLLILSEQIVSIVFIFIMLFAILILYKQISIWFFEHYKRILIINLHGGSILYSAMPIIQVAFVGSIIASALTVLLSFEIKNNLPLILSPEILNIIVDIDNLDVNYIQIVLMSFGISLISILGVLIKHKISSRH
jgi:cell division transport system permease protein